MFHWAPELFPGAKWPGHDVDHSSLSSAEVKNEWSYTSAPSICIHRIDRNTLITLLRVRFLFVMC